VESTAFAIAVVLIFVTLSFSVVVLAIITLTKDKNVVINTVTRWFQIQVEVQQPQSVQHPEIPLGGKSKALPRGEQYPGGGAE
jgi:hypothetical protein